MNSAKIKTSKGFQKIQIEKAPECIAKLYAGIAFPVVCNGKLYLAKYEREIDDLFIIRSLSNAEIYQKAAEGCKHIFEAKAVEAAQLVAAELQQLANALDELTPPWA